jgi:hypothetical protein
MNLGSWRRNRLRERVLLWLLPALVFRAFIPAGFMPASGHGLMLELCSAAGYGAAFVEYEPAASGDGHAGDVAGGHEPCAFAASASAAPSPSVAAIVLAASSFDEPRASHSVVRLPESPSLRPLPRAPPRFA